MKLLEKILVPINLKNKSEEQLKMAKILAEKFHSQVILLHVLPPEAKKESIYGMIKKYVEDDFDKLVSDFNASNINTLKVIRIGNTFDQIMSVADDENVNVILLSHELDPVGKEYKIGVVTEKLLRKSNKPVWVLKPRNKLIPEKILCPVDFSDASERALNNAIKIARTFQAKLTIINVYEPLEEKSTLRYKIDYDKENEYIKNESRIRFEEFLKKFNFTGIDYTKKLLKGKIYEQINAFAAENAFDHIFIGATGKSLIQRVLLGSVTEMVLREFPSSMIITKSENILNLKIDNDISNIEKHYAQAIKLEETGYYNEAIHQLEICLQINDLHIPAISSLVRLHDKAGNDYLSKTYKLKLDEILKRLWDKKIELEIRKKYNINQ